MSEKISQMSSGNPAQNTDMIPIARPGSPGSVLQVTAQSLAALAASGATPGQPVVNIPGTTSSPGFPNGALAFLDNGETCGVFFAGTSLNCLAQTWNFTINVANSLGIGAATVIKCAAGSGTVVSTVTVTWRSNPTPTLSGSQTCDNIAMPLDAAHNYYICLYVTSAGDVDLQQLGDGGIGGTFTGLSGNQTTMSPVVISDGTVTTGNWIVTSILAAS